MILIKSSILSIFLTLFVGFFTCYAFGLQNNFVSSQGVLLLSSGLSKGEIKKLCIKYENKLIGYYEKIFLVKNCKREYVSKIDQVNLFIKRYGAVYNVDSSIIRALPLKPPLEKKEPSCKSLNGKILLTFSGRLFEVKNCEKIEFPDWETYLAYKKAGKIMSRKIHEMEDDEIAAIKGSSAYPSILNREYKEFLLENEDYDIIPASRACKNLEGKFTTYYSKFYKIEKCKKREVDLDYIKSKVKFSKLVELTSSQWLSIPKGKPITLDSK